MVRVLNVAEKPSVAKAISAILGRGPSRRNGFSEFNPIWEFPYMLQGQQCDMVFTSVAGHLMELEFDPAFKQWQSCAPIRLFDAPISKRVPDDKMALKHTLEREARGCQWLVLWLDCDREGENIAFEVLDVCTAVNKHMQIFRAHFSALIPQDIIQACTRFTPPNKHYSDAVDCRQEIDLRIGAAFTRWQTLRLQARFPLESIVSYGPCQFPTLGFVVERFNKRQEFISEAFWKIDCACMHENTRVEFNWDRNCVFDQISARIMFEESQGQPAVVTSAVCKDKSHIRPTPLATVEFQKRVSKSLRISSTHAMDLAEKLYQKGFISYPRTETDIFKEGTDLMGLVTEQTHNPGWGAYAQSLVNGGFRHPRAGTNDDKAHPPIHPTKRASGLDGDMARVYEFICRHFLACCSDDARGQQTTLKIDVGYEGFHASGVMVTAKNWLDVYPYEHWNSRMLPLLRVGHQFPVELKLSEGKTVPPQLLTEADLINLMDKNGIGTDATIAQHIQTIQDRGYAEIRGTYFHPTDLGVGLVAGYDAMGLAMSQPTLRAHMESAMKGIGEGTRRKEEVLASCLADMKAVFIQVTQMADRLDAKIANFFPRLGDNDDAMLLVAQLSTCGECGTKMDMKQSTSGRGQRFLYCARCRKSHNLPLRGDISPHAHVCPICNFQVLTVSNDNKTHTLCPFCFNDTSHDIENAAGGLPGFRCFNCTRADCLLSVPKGEPVRACPDCGKDMLLKISVSGMTKSYYLACAGYPVCRRSMNLPCKSVVRLPRPCPNCPRSFMLSFTFALGKVPYHIPLEYEGCVGGCDETLTDLFELDRRAPPPPRAPLHQRAAAVNGQQHQQHWVNHSWQGAAKRGSRAASRAGAARGASRGGRPMQFPNTTQSFSELRGGGQSRGKRRATRAQGGKRKARTAHAD